jgi:hypothetical protein
VASGNLRASDAFLTQPVGRKVLRRGQRENGIIHAAPDLAGEGTIWYVNASSVNVRAEPSTDAEVLGKLGSG